MHGPEILGEIRTNAVDVGGYVLAHMARIVIKYKVKTITPERGLRQAQLSACVQCNTKHDLIVNMNSFNLL